MGKAKTKKFKAPKPQPTGLPDLKDFEEVGNSNGVPECEPADVVVEILEKLGSVKPDERECGCTLVATLSGQPSTVQGVVQHGIKVLAPLLLDPNPHIQHRALGALRNLCVEGGEEVCDELVEKDVTTPLTALFHKYGVGWTPSPKEASASKVTDTKVGIFVEAVHLLWNLCENCNLAVRVFNKENLISYLLPCLSEEARSMYGLQTAIVVAQCLQTVTEQNEEAAVVCRQDQHLNQLLSLVQDTNSDSQHVLLRALSAATLANISGGNLSSAPGNVVTSVVSAVADVLSVDTNPLLKDAASSLSQNGHGDQHDTSEHQDIMEAEDHGSQHLQDVSQILSAQRVALAVAGNLCVSEDDEWADADSDESNSSEEIGAGDCCMEMEDSSEPFDPLSLPIEVMNALQQKDLVKKVLSRTQPAQTECLAALQKTREGKKVVKKLESVQVDALLCVNNLVSASESLVLGGMAELHHVWDSLSQLSTSTQAAASEDLLEAVTSAMRAVMEKLGKLQSPKFSEVTAADLQFLFGLGRQSSHSKVRVNAIRIVATIGCLLAQSPAPHPLIKDCGLFLLECVEHDPDLRVVAEALDAVFDVFAEDHLRPVAQELSLVPKLSQFLPALKAKMSAQKRNLGEDWPMVTTVKKNLVLFIKYNSRH